MTRRRRWKTRVDLPLPVLFCLALLLALDGTGLLRVSLACALLHESGHLLVYWHYFHRWPRLSVSPVGIGLSMRGVFLPAGRELLLAAAGPLVNFVCSAAAILWMRCWGYAYLGYWFASANLLLGLMNLLPVPGLDGAHILRCLWDGLHCGPK